MSRRIITRYNALFTKLILSCIKDDININIAKICKDENILIADEHRLRAFWRKFKKRFEMNFEIELKDTKEKELFENEFLKYDIGDNETVGDYLRRIRIKKKFMEQTRSDQSPILH